MHRLLLLVALTACGGSETAPVAEAPAAGHEAEGHHDDHATAHAEEAAEAGSPEAAGADEAGFRTYGAPFTVSEAIAARTLLDDPASYVGKTVRVEGRVADVCQAKGCWMVLADGPDQMRVRMAGHGFGIDRQSRGGQADLEGVIVARKLDPKEVEHFASEASDGAAVPEQQAQGDTVYEIEATSVRVKRADS